jgi:hypothetical protein
LEVRGKRSDQFVTVIGMILMDSGLMDMLSDKGECMYSVARRFCSYLVPHIIIRQLLPHYEGETSTVHDSRKRVLWTLYASEIHNSYY